MKISRVSKESTVGKLLVLQESYQFLADLHQEYPGFSRWFWAKVVPGVLMGSRDLLYCRDKGRLVAILITKKSRTEKKICTLRVADGYKKQGIGSELLLTAFDVLETTKPLITVPEVRLPEFRAFLMRRGFVLEEICQDYYVPGEKEYCFNGCLSKAAEQQTPRTSLSSSFVF